MSFNIQTFKTRAITSVFFVVVMLAGLLWNTWSFFILFSIIHFGAWMEYQKLVRRFNPDYAAISTFHRIGIMILGWSLMIFFSNDMIYAGSMRGAFWAGLILAVIMPMIFFLESRKMMVKNIVYSFTGLLYISLSLALLMDMRTRWSEEQYQLSMTIPLLVVFSLWVNDTMAYIAGSLFGKTPLTPVSPRKTREGTVAGIILTVLVISAAAHFTGRLDFIHAAAMSLLASVTGTYGDIFESRLKRMAGVKDSGNILPGHGGFLDRFDSLFFASVAVWFYAVIVFG